jgi:Protein of unknown function (DUF1552)
MKSQKLVNRRLVLRGLGGVAVGLPMLDIFEPKGAAAQAAARPVYSALMLQQNGAVQGNGGDPDMFWPSGMGAIDKAMLAGAPAQTISELADYADKIACVRGMNFHYSNNHDGGPIAASCGSPVTGDGTKQLPTTESVDVFVANAMTPGTPPLTLYAGVKGTFRDDAFSFNKGGVLRIGDNNPFNVYKRLVGMTGMDPMMVDKIAQRRLSVNDLIRSDLNALLARTDLSKDDRDRLDLHLTSVRELEVNTTMISGPALDQAALMAVDGKAATANENMEKVVRLFFDLIAFSFASNRARTATLQVGGCNDHTRYTINGTVQPPYHFISHRIQSDGDDGADIPNAIDLHHEIDKIHARMFKYLLDRLSAYTLPGGGTLLDSSVNLWVNSVADGPPHSGNNIPHVLAGGANGFLKMGQHFKVASKSYTNLALNTIASACGVRKADGSNIDNFGDPASTGILTQLLA